MIPKLGVSIHFPLFYLNYKPKYEHLAFSAATYRDEMVKAVVNSKR